MQEVVHGGVAKMPAIFSIPMTLVVSTSMLPLVIRDSGSLNRMQQLKRSGKSPSAIAMIAPGVPFAFLYEVAEPLDLLVYFCSKPGSAPAIAPVTDGGSPNLLARLLISPPSMALATGLPEAIPASNFDRRPPNIPSPSAGCEDKPLAT